MKKIKLFLGSLLMISALITASNQSFAQGCICAVCQSPCSSPHLDSRCSQFVKQSTDQNSGAGTGGSLDQMLLNGLINGMSNAAYESDAKKKVAEAKEKARLDSLRIIESKRLAEEIRKSDSTKQADHDQMKQEYKTIGETDTPYKSLDDKKTFTPIKFACKITSFSGYVNIKRANGEQFQLGDDANFDLRVGDRIITGENGKIKIHYDFENGGKDVVIGNSSDLRILQDNDGSQYPFLKNGKYLKNEGFLDAAAKKAREAFLQTEMGKRMRKINDVRTPSVSLASRGTTYSVTEDSLKGTELIVMDGSVEITSEKTRKSVLVEAGYKASVTPDGIITGPEKIDETAIIKWWED